MKRLHRRPLEIPDILAWADAHREATGHWPTKTSGTVFATKFETWQNVDNALRAGLRGLPDGSSLAQLLAERRGVRNIHRLPPLTEAQILQWADAHRARTGRWPTAKSGKIPDSGGEKWNGIEVALRNGARGLPGGSSLAQLLAAHRGKRNRKRLPPLTEAQILDWADRHRERTGTWPRGDSGPIPDAPGETWTAVDVALNHGLRGLPGGSSLALVLAEHRDVRNAWNRPNLSVAEILHWADAFHDRQGKWPGVDAGPIPEASGDTWLSVDHALRRGSRGLPGGYSLAELLAVERDVRNHVTRPAFRRKQIRAWAKAHYRRTGRWPTAHSGPIHEAPTETWMMVQVALENGCRGLRGGSSLAQFLAATCGKRNHLALPPLSYKKILAWADAHHERTGQWPNVNSGPLVDAPGERWDLIDNALRQGHRTLPGGSSLRCLLVKKRGLRHPLHLPDLTEEQVLHWAEQHRERMGAWPRGDTGVIAEAPEETWLGVDFALRRGKRGLPGQSSLAQLLAARGTGP